MYRFVTSPGSFRRVSRVLAAVLATTASTSLAEQQSDIQTSVSGPVVDAETQSELDALSALSIEQLMEVDVVVAAGKREQTSRQAAASVSVVRDSEMNLLGHRNLADLLRNQRSFYLSTDGLSTFAGVRGFLRPGEWNARLLVLVDGRPTRENIYGMTFLDHGLNLPVEAYKRVEIIRGPGSALYGGNAVFGVVNIVTKDGADLNGGLVRARGGTHGTAELTALYGFGTEDGWDFLAGAAAFTSHGEDSIHYSGVDGAANNFGDIEGWDQEKSLSGFLKIKRGPFTAMIDYAERERDNRSATYFTSFHDPGTMDEARANASLAFDHDFNNGHAIHASVYFGNYRYDQDMGYAIDPDVSFATYNYTSRAFNSWIGEEIHHSWKVTPRFHLLTGADATQALQTEQRDVDDLGTDIRVNESYNAFGFFSEATWDITDALTLVAGGRFDHIQDVGDLISPRAGAILRLSDADTLKALYGRAFRPPNLYEMFYVSSDGYLPNPNLQPEVVDTYELVWERQFQSGWQTSVGGFLWRMSDAMEDVVLPDDSNQVQNVGTVEARGVELELNRRWESGGLIRTYATFTQTADPDGRQLPLSPRWITGAAVVFPIVRNHTFLSVDTQIVGHMKSEDGYETDPTCITNVVFTSRRFLDVDNLEFQAGLYNLFGNDARLPNFGSYNHLQPALNWPEPRALVSLTYRF